MTCTACRSRMNRGRTLRVAIVARRGGYGHERGGVCRAGVWHRGRADAVHGRMEHHAGEPPAARPALPCRQRPPTVSGETPAPPAFDYLVVGAGFAGSAKAERLASQCDKTVLVCDVLDHIG